MFYRLKPIVNIFSDIFNNLNMLILEMEIEIIFLKNDNRLIKKIAAYIFKY